MNGFDPATEPCPDPLTLVRYLAGELADDLERSVESHLTACTDCERLLGQLAGDSVLENLGKPGVDLPPRTEPTAEQSSPGLSELLARLREIARLVPLKSPGNDEADDDLATRQVASAEKTFRSEFVPTSADADPPTVRKVGRFVVRNEVGRGGFGIVYQAFDSVLNRVVALKVSRDHRLDDTRVHERFLREAQAAARLTHPNIVSVYEAGESNGVLFLAMEYCAGMTLEQWARQQDDVALATAVEIVAQLAEAVGHAHNSGVFHRDIKPGNVLMDAEHSSGRLRFTPRLTDFGLVQFADDSGTATAEGVLQGTPRYMAPEQATGSRYLIGPHTDVYSLGVILYELLTGQAPIEGANAADTLRRIVVETPSPPSRLRSGIPRDLDAVCRRCLEKSTVDRYATARDLADDLRRLQRGEPTTARPLRSHEQLGRWIGSHPGVTSSLAAVMVLILLSSLGLVLHSSRLNQLLGRLREKNEQLTSTQQLLDAELSTRRATEERLRERAREQERFRYHHQIELADRAWHDRDYRHLSELLDQQVPAQPGDPDLRGLEWRRLRVLSKTPHRAAEVSTDALYTVLADPRGQWLLTSGKTGRIAVLDRSTLTPMLEFDADQSEINACQLTSDRSTLLTAGDDGTVKLWSTDDWRFQRAIRVLGGAIAYSIAVLPGDEEFLVAGRSNAIERYRMSGERVASYEEHQNVVESISLVGDGWTLISASSDHSTRIWSIPRVASEPPVCRRIGSHDRRVLAVAGVPGGPEDGVPLKFIVSAGIDSRLIVVDPSGKELSRQEHLDEIQSVAVSPDGRMIASADRAGTIQIWSVGPSGNITRIDSWSAHRGRVYSMQFLEDSQQLVSVGGDGGLSLWSLSESESRGEYRHEPGTRAETEAVIAVPGTTCVASAHDDEIRLHDVVRAQVTRVWRFPGMVWRRVACSPDSQWWVAGSVDGKVCVWKRDSDEPVWLMDAFPGHSVAEVSVSGDGRWVVAISVDSELADRIRLYDIGSRRRAEWLPVAKASVAALSQSGRYLTCAIDGVNAVQVWDLRRRRLRWDSRRHASTVRVLCFSEDERRIVSGARDRRVLLYDVESGDLLHAFGSHADAIAGAAFVPGETGLITTDRSGAAIIWDAELGLEHYRLFQTAQLRSVGVAAGGTHVLLQTDAGSWTVLDCRTQDSPSVSSDR